MRLSRIYVDQFLDEGAQIRLNADSCHYLKNVLRLKSGATIALFNGRDIYDYESLLCYEGKRAFATIQDRVAGKTESALSAEIIQGLSSRDHMDWMVQKCTELGASRISIFNAKHTQIPLKSIQLEKRLAHWRNIAIKACEQCGRQIPPRVKFQKNLLEVLDDPILRDLKILLDLQGDRLPTGPQTNKMTNQITVLLGPEGGLSEAEIKTAQNAGFVASSLGPRVLRTETAAVTALSILQYHYGDI
jgi:16S rRNA (uracil1498-N3)-methyltransferase